MWIIFVILPSKIHHIKTRKNETRIGIVLSALALLSLTFVSCAVGLSGSSSGTDEIATYETVKSALDKLKSDNSRIIGLSVEAAGSSLECNTEFGYAQAEIIDSDNNVFLQVFCPDVSKPRPWNNAKQVKYADVQSLTLDRARASMLFL